MACDEDSVVARAIDILDDIMVENRRIHIHPLQVICISSFGFMLQNFCYCLVSVSVFDVTQNWLSVTVRSNCILYNCMLCVVGKYEVILVSETVKCCYYKIMLGIIVYRNKAAHSKHIYLDKAFDSSYISVYIFLEHKPICELF